MTPKTLNALETRLEGFLGELTEPMGRRERRRGAQVYSAGLVVDGERKSIAPMAHRIAGADAHALRQVVGPSPWAVEAGQRRLALKVVDSLSEPAVWIIDETAFPNAGRPSVGVTRQSCGTLGQVANGQVALRGQWSRADASGPLTWGLSLPQAWLYEQERAAQVSVPPAPTYRRKTALALDLMDQGRSWEVPALLVVADALYGHACGFRQALRQRQVSSAVAGESTTSVWTEDPHVPRPPPHTTGRPRRSPPWEARPRPTSLPLVATQLPASAGTPMTWRQGRRGPQRSRCGMVQVWAAHGWREHKPPERGPSGGWWHGPEAGKHLSRMGWRTLPRSPLDCGPS